MVWLGLRQGMRGRDVLDQVPTHLHRRLHSWWREETGHELCHHLESTRGACCPWGDLHPGCGDGAEAGAGLGRTTVSASATWAAQVTGFSCPVPRQLFQLHFIFCGIWAWGQAMERDSGASPPPGTQLLRAVSPVPSGPSCLSSWA